jgi:DNA primase
VAFQKEYIEALLDRTDIVGVILRYLPLKKKGKDYYCRCPFHLERHASFMVSPTKQWRAMKKKVKRGKE